MSNAIVFIDSLVSDYQSLLLDLPSDVEVHLLDAKQDGLLQIASIVQNRTDLSAIHIISHGSRGQLQLGSNVLNSEALGSYKNALSMIAASLKANGDILLYGCNVAQGNTGLQFIDNLAAYTGADVAASVDLTGNSRLGGNWVLEQSTGAIEANRLNLANYQYTLTANTAPTFFFGSGMVITDLGSSVNDYAQSVIQQSDGKLVVAGYSSIATGNDQFALVRYNSDGSLDTSFSGNGIATKNLGSYDDRGYQVIRQSNGKLVVAGIYTDANSSNFALVRYNTDGSLDTSFSGNGTQTTDIGADNGNDIATCVVQQSDGKLVVAGHSWINGDWDFALARYTSTGALDTSFSGDGQVTNIVSATHNDEIYSIIQQKHNGANNGLVVAGQALIGGDYDFALARYNLNGSLDTSFGGDGKVTTIINSNQNEGAYSVIEQTNGKLVAAGYTYNGSNNDFALVRYNSDGSLDASFDNDGILTTNLGGNDVIQSVIQQSDGKLLVVGYSNQSGNYDFVLVRYTSAGVLDTSFNNGNGKVIISTGGGDQAYSVIQQSDGKLVVTGYGNGHGAGHDFTTLRYNLDGSIDDTTFNAQDTLGNTVSYTENASAIALNNSVHLRDAELRDGNYSGASITLARQGGADSSDIFGATGNLSFSGANVVLSGVTIGTVSNSAGTLTITFNSNGTQTRLDQALSALTYSNSSDNPPASVIINWTFNDGNTGTQGTGGALSTVGNTTVSITAVNDAPTATNLSVAENYTEDTPLNLVDSVVSDADSTNITATLLLNNASAGSLNTATSGAVTSTYNSTTGTWTASGALANVNSLLAGLTFTPAANFNGSFSIASTISDGALSVSGSKVFTGVAVNDAPTTANGSITAVKDGIYTFLSSNFSFADTNDSSANNLNAVIITSLPALGTLKNSGTAVVIGTANATIANISDLTYTPVAGASGLNYANFIFEVQDDGGVLNGGVNTSTAKIMNIDVSLTANTVVTGSVTLSTTTPQQGDTLTLSNTLSDTNGLGTFNYAWYAGGVLIKGALTNSYTLTQAEVGKTISATISYVDGVGYSESVSSSATSAVSAVNDAPSFIAASTITNNIKAYPSHTLGESRNSVAFAALLVDGSAVTWGSNSNGGNSSAVAAQLNGTIDVTAIYSADTAIAALRADGSVVTWGNSSNGGNSNTVATQLNGIIDVNSIYSTNTAFAALRADGSVVTWGNSSYGGNSNAVATQLDGTLKVTSIYSAKFAFAALRADGSVVTWGSSSSGGDSSPVAAQINGTIDVTSISSTETAFAALRVDGSVVTWGGSSSGGDSGAVAAQLNGTIDVTAIYSATTAFAALRADGSVVTWGDNSWGGNSSTVAAQLNGTIDATSIYSTTTAFAALRADGSVITWGDSSSGGDSGAVAAQLNGTIDVTAIYSTTTAFAALRADGSVVTWGSSSGGGNSSAVATQLDGAIDVTMIRSTVSAFAALRTDGSVVTWGGNGGDSSAVAMQLNGTVDVTAIYSTGGAFAAFRIDGSVVAWGSANGGNSSAVSSQLSSNVVSIADIYTDGNPAQNSLGNTISFTENSSAVILDSHVSLSDAELDALNGGLGNYNQSTLTLTRSTGTNSDDVFSSNASGNLSFSGANVIVAGTTIGSFSQNNGTLTITFNSNASKTLVNNALQQITYSNSSDAPPASVQITWTFNDANTGAQGTGGALNAIGSTTINISAVNDAPSFTNLNAPVSFTENSSAVILDSHVSVSDAELDALNSGLGNYNQSTLTLARSTGTNSDDVFSSNASGNLSFSGANVIVAGTTIGSFSQSNGNLTITFNSNATQSLVNSALQQITYSNSSDTPPNSVQLKWTFNDANTVAQGTGGALTATGLTTVNITAVNDTPTGSVTISGTAVQGQSLQVSNSLADADGLGTISYQWLADGVAISGATNAVYTLSEADVSKTLTVTANYTDAGGTFESVASSNSISAPSLPVGSLVVNNTAMEFEQGWFKVNLQAGTNYQIDVKGSATGDGTLSDPYFYGIYDSTGTFLGYKNDDGLANSNAQVLFTPSTTGDYYLAVGGFGTATGTYQFLVSPLAPISDDYAADATTTGVLTNLASTITGTIESQNDQDWFKVTLQANVAYVIDLEGASTSKGTANDPYLAGIYNSSTTLLGYSNDDGGLGTNAQVLFTPSTTGDYYLAAGAWDTGSYQLSVSQAIDDYASDTSTTGILPVSSTVTATIDRASDQDWFKTSLIAGTSYRIDLEGSTTSKGTLSDPYFRGVYDATGTFLGANDNDGGSGTNAQALFTPSVTGDYYLNAGTADGTLGSYQLSVSVTDYPDNTSTSAALDTAPSATVGMIDTASDKDWFKVSLEANASYLIDLQGSSTGNGTLSDPYFRGIYNSTGLFLGYSDNDSGNGTNAQVSFTPTSTGDYYLDSGAVGTNTGSYQLSVSLNTDDYAATTSTIGQLSSLPNNISGVIGKAGDEDWFKVHLTTGHTYTINLEASATNKGTLSDPDFKGIYNSTGTFLGYSDNDSGDGTNAQVSFTPTSSGDYYLDAGAVGTGTGTYQLFVSLEDCSANTSTTETMTAPNSTTPTTLSSVIDTSNDQDWIRVFLEADTTYLIDLQGSTTAKGTLSDPYFKGIYNSAGAFLGHSNDDNQISLNSRVLYTPSSSENYYLAVGAFSRNTGSYQLAVSELAQDDYAASIDTIGVIGLGQSVTGVIEQASDQDWFKVSLVAGTHYVINLNSLATPQGTLSDPLLRGIYNSAGIFLGHSNDDTGLNLNAQVIDFTPTITGDYYLAASAFSANTGSYQLSIAELVTPSDDYAADSTTTAVISTALSATGAIETAGDQDWFKVSLVAGVNYLIDLEGAPSDKGTLNDPYFYGIYNNLGVSLGHSNDDGNSNSNAQILFTPSTLADYYLVAAAYKDNTGSYQLTIAPATNSQDDYSVGITSTGQVIASHLATAVTGVIDTTGDQDWFKVALTAGVTYQINLESSAINKTALSDPYFAGIYDNTGAFLGHSDDNSGLGNNAQVLFTPTTTADYYLSAGATGTSTGNYQLSVGYNNAPTVAASLSVSCLASDSTISLDLLAGASDVDSDTLNVISLLSDNLLSDAGGEANQHVAWMISNGGDGWAITSDNTNAHSGTHAFISSYALGTLSQEVDLVAKGYSATYLDTAPTIDIGTFVKGYSIADGSDADKYQVLVSLLDANHQTISTYDTGLQNTSSTWLNVAHSFSNYGAGVRYVSFAESGRSDEYWARQYGAIFDDASVQLPSRLPAATSLANNVLSFNPSNTAYSNLAAGQTQNIVIPYRISDEQASVAQIATISLTGINDAPTGKNISVATSEDSSYTFSTNDFGFSDVDSPADNLLKVIISSLPLVGSLQLNNTAVSANQSIKASDIALGLLQFIPVSNANGSQYANFTFKLQDDGGVADGGSDTSVNANSLTIAVTPVPDISLSAGINPVEGGVTGSFTLTLDNPAPATGLIVNYSLTGSSATLTTDYHLEAGTNTSALTANSFSIAAGATSATVNVIAATDVISDPNETVNLSLATGVNYQLSSATTAQITIAEPEFIASPNPIVAQTTSEAGATVNYSIALKSAPQANTSLSFVSSNSAEGIVLNPNLTFTATNWSIAQTVSIRGVDDNSQDGNVAYSVDALINDDPSLNIGSLHLINLDNTVVNLSGDKGKAQADTLTGNEYNDTLSGYSLSDSLSGAYGNDALWGGYGNDTLDGGGDNDVLMGENGVDKLIGGAGNDTLDGGASNDSLDGGAGNDSYILGYYDRDAINDSGSITDVDTISLPYQISPYSLPSSIENGTVVQGTRTYTDLSVYGSVNAASDTLTGNARDNKLIGNEGNNNLNGDLGNDTLIANAGNDTLNGSAGNDLLIAGLNNNTLTGGLGLDTFQLGNGIAKITDFVVLDDTINLARSIFTQLTATGIINSNYFKIGVATDNNDYLLYNKTTGVLSYDTDGNDAHTAITIATLGVNLALSNADFVVI